MVPFQLNRSEMSFRLKLNFPFLMGIWNPTKLNEMVNVSPVTGQRSWPHSQIDLDTGWAKRQGAVNEQVKDWPPR
jgi:hypothetical protein